jgi:hypothetical protein
MLKLLMPSERRFRSEPGCWKRQGYGRRCFASTLADLPMSPSIFAGGLATMRVHSHLDRHDFVRLELKGMGTTLQDSTNSIQ